MPQDQLGLFDTPPSRNDIRLSVLLIVVLFAFLPVTMLLGDRPLGQFAAFIPMIGATTALTDFVIATLLFVQASVFRSRGLHVMASGYVFTGLVLIPHALTFPGAFAPHGLLGAGVSTTAWLYIFWRSAFPIVTIAYVLLGRADSARDRLAERQLPRIVLGVLTAAILALAVTALTTLGHDLLPSLYVSTIDSNRTNMITVTAVLLGLFVLAMGLLLWRRRSLLDLWLVVVLTAWLIQTLILTSLPGRFSAGWYAAVVVVLFSHVFLMIALLAESAWLYARLALTSAARNRERDARLMSMDAVAAAISHEVGQPLAAVTVSARAGLNWLDREQPHVENARKSLEDALNAGHRSFDVLKSTRTMFAKGPGLKTEFGINDLVRETVSLLESELAAGKVALQLDLDDTLAPIRADRVQTQQVLINLLANAIESLTDARGRSRRIAISSRPLEDCMLLEVSDNGPGIPEDKMANIFDTFFTTKPTGTGLGLALCRTIVEEHGGRLWASQSDGQGATFHLQLPQQETRTAAAS